MTPQPVTSQGFATGTLRVSARNYWFTAGGDKGSFGYYPHLKDGDGYPVYPDTQLHGDLRMVAAWLLNLDRGVSALRLEEVFGAGGGDHLKNPSTASRLFVGDLELSREPRRKWTPERFSVKTRIRIDDDTRTVDEHFLVNLELANVNGMVLEAPIFLGPFGPDKLQQAKVMIESATKLLSGFGAFRSRGYGRGDVSIAWDPDAQPRRADFPGKAAMISLTALTHFRSKPVDPGTVQALPTTMAIDQAQFKGWLAKACFETHGLWPAPEQMASLRMSSLYPSPAGAERPTYPAPMNTLRDEEGKIRNLQGYRKGEDHERGFFQSKTSPLGTGWVVDDDKNAHAFTACRRIRNRMDNDTFTTGEAGLFSQDYLPRGTVFRGRLSLDGCTEDFAGKIRDVLTQSYPVIKGTIFSLALGRAPEALPRTGGPALVMAPLPYHRRPDGGSAVNLGTQRGYNTALKRPRRPRPVVLPGSVFSAGTAADDMDDVVPWRGFGEQLTHVAPQRKDEEARKVSPEGRNRIDSKDLCRVALQSLSRAQAGQLREMLHPKLADKTVKDGLAHRIHKYGKSEKTFGHIAAILEKIADKLAQGGRGAMNAYVEALLDEYALIQWERKNKGGCSHD